MPLKSGRPSKRTDDPDLLSRTSALAHINASVPAKAKRLTIDQLKRLISRKVLRSHRGDQDVKDWLHRSEVQELADLVRDGKWGKPYEGFRNPQQWLLETRGEPIEKKSPGPKPAIAVSIASLVYRDDDRLPASSTSPEPIPFAVRLHGDYEWTLLDLGDGVLETWWDFEGDGTETPSEDSEDVDWLVSEGYGVVSEEVLKGSHSLYPVASKLKSEEHRP